MSHRVRSISCLFSWFLNSMVGPVWWLIVGLIVGLIAGLIPGMIAGVVVV